MQGDKVSPEISTEMNTSKPAEETKPGVTGSALPDITALDIKSNLTTSKDKMSNGDVDFFRDMEPVISKTQVLYVDATKNKFDVELDEATGGDGWDDTFEDLEPEPESEAT